MEKYEKPVITDMGIMHSQFIST